MLLCDPASKPAQPLLDRVLLERAAEAGRFWKKACFADLRLLDLMER